MKTNSIYIYIYIYITKHSWTIGGGVIKWLGWMVGCVFTGDLHLKDRALSQITQSRVAVSAVLAAFPCPRMPSNIKGIQPLNMA